MPEKLLFQSRGIPNLSGRIDEIYVRPDLDGTHRVVQDTPESADCCFDWRDLDQGLSQEEAKRRVREYLSGKRPTPSW